MSVFRAPWAKFPALTIHAVLTAVRSHPLYTSAAQGNLADAETLVADFFRASQLPKLSQKPIDFVVPLTRPDQVAPRNSLPLALAKLIAGAVGARVHSAVVTPSRFPETAPTSINRLTNQAEFTGPPPKGNGIIVTDFVAYGSSIANLRGYLLHHGCTVAFASSLCAEFGSARIAPDPFTVQALKKRFRPQLAFLTTTLGFEPDLLTNREALAIYALPSLEPLRDTRLPTHLVFGPTPST